MSMKIKNDDGEIMKAGGIILNDNNEVLLVATPKRDIWSYPKGHMEEGETKDIAAKREILEETGYDVKILKQLSDITYINRETKGPIRIQMFLMRPVTKIDNGEKEVVKEWFSLEEAKRKLPSNLALLLEEI